MYKEIKYNKIGYLHDIIIVSKNSEFATRTVQLENLENQIMYVPRNYAQTVENIKRLTSKIKINFKNSSYKTILECASSGQALGVITKEYVKSEELERLNLVEVNIQPKLEEIEFGYFTNSNKFKELNDFIKEIKEYFKV